MNMRFSVLSSAKRLLFWFGVAALAYVGGTVAYAGIYQSYQSWKFQQTDAVTPHVAVDIQDGDPVGRLEIPRIGISVMVLQGTSEGSLAAGAGHVPGTPLPGTGGNVAIAAHRDTFFRSLKEIRPGDSIRFSTVHQTFEYVVASMETVDPKDTRVIESRAVPELTLITCFPFYYVGSAPKRFIVHALPLK